MQEYIFELGSVVKMSFKAVFIFYFSSGIHCVQQSKIFCDFFFFKLGLVVQEEMVFICFLLYFALAAIWLSGAEQNIKLCSRHYREHLHEIILNLGKQVGS